VHTQQRSIQLLGQVILPQARQSVDVTSSSYQAGGADYLTLTTNWRKLLDFQLLYHQSVSQYHQDMADLKRLLGGHLPDVRPRQAQ
jgi:outer membrane protein TolC